MLIQVESYLLLNSKYLLSTYMLVPSIAIVQMCKPCVFLEQYSNLKAHNLSSLQYKTYKGS